LVLDFLSEFGTAIEHQRKENSEQRGEQDGPADATSPSEKDNGDVFLG
jgi:hypothetical protein